MRNKGSTIVETLIYIFIFTLLSLAIVNVLHTLTSSYSLIKSSVAVESAAETALEKIARDVRESSSIDIAGSIFSSSPGTLLLNTTDEDGNAATLYFFLSGNTVRIRENGVDIGPLTSSQARVTSLVFYPITAANSEAVKIEMTVESGEGENYKSKTFHTTAVLRGSYAP